MPFRCFGWGGESQRNITTVGKNDCSLAAAASNLTRIFEELKCPVCFNVCVPPIHNCVNGHIVCSHCKQKGNVTACPTCREGLLGARNFFAENFVLNYAQQCRYASQGCEHLRLKGCNMKPHQEKCMFRPLKCIVDNCGLVLPYKTILSHLDFAHKASGTTTLPATIPFRYPKKFIGRARKWVPYYIHAFGNIYYVMMQQRGKRIAIWVYSQTCKESDELEYEHFALIKIRHPEKKIVQSWCGAVYGIRTPKVEIMTDGCCFMLPKKSLKKFTSQGMLHLYVDIQKSRRTNLKGVTISNDSDTAVISSLPAEYSRPPSFYEPKSSVADEEADSSHSSPTPVPPTMDQNQNTNNLNQEIDQNGNSTVKQLHLQQPATEDKAPQRTRTAAIATWKHIMGPHKSGSVPTSLSASFGSSKTNSLHSSLNGLTLQNDDQDLPEENCIDKIPSNTDLTVSADSVT